MKATIEFTLPEEDHQFRVASTAQELAATLWDVDHILREVTKYGADPMAAVERSRNLINRLRDRLE